MSYNVASIRIPQEYPQLNKKNSDSRTIVNWKCLIIFRRQRETLFLVSLSPIILRNSGLLNLDPDPFSEKCAKILIRNILLK